jgi:hypothetical protein
LSDATLKPKTNPCMDDNCVLPCEKNVKYK